MSNTESRKRLERKVSSLRSVNRLQRDQLKLDALADELERRADDLDGDGETWSWTLLSDQLELSEVVGLWLTSKGSLGTAAAVLVGKWRAEG